MRNILFVFLLVILTGCKTQNKYSDFDYSYSRSGGFAPIYENLLIKGNTAHYSFEGQGKNIKKDFKLSNDEVQNLETVIAQNNFRTIQEDYKKVYDNVATSVNVKTGENSGSKSDASFIMEKDKPRWEAVVASFRQIINAKVKTETTKK
ncbi:hypothetical protein L0B70_08670 [Kaistella sp. 97-N-M2]|uniref:hypothetical protein n=1 Tax=Kaistella sp. 97-N-M2 TaxID=2908645 RepID=UPI001F3B45B6|nr:hypothetical protein [Kaistella sp. 97-N-M2]UJF28930.1 hypothetical protein L0B70_08670 [Kaistella sp. 97-N-M2]